MMPTVRSAEEIFRERLAELVKTFETLPTLSADSIVGTQAFGMPKLIATNASTDSENADYDRGDITNEALEFVDLASTKLLYGEFKLQQIDKNDLCWASDVIVGKLGKDLNVSRISVGSTPAINSTPEAAVEWFRNDVIRQIEVARGSSVQMLLGPPGVGKSTLMKFLVNDQRQFSSSKGVIFTRLEARKFISLFGNKILPPRAVNQNEPSAEPPSSLRQKQQKIDVQEEAYYDYFLSLERFFNEYFHYLTLRDLFENYDRNLFFPQKPNSQSLLADLLGRDEDGLVVDVYEVFNSAIKNGFSSSTFRKLQKISRKTPDEELFPRLATGLTRVAEQAINRKINYCVIFDGLDMLGPEDELLNSTRLLILKFVLHTYGLWSPSTELDMRIPAFETELRHHCFLAIRPVTLEVFVSVNHISTFPRTYSKYKLAPLQANAVLLKSLYRSFRKIDKTEGAESELFQSILQLAFGLFERWRILSDKSVRQVQILEIFDGNLRDCLLLLRRMFHLLCTEFRRVSGPNSLRPSLDELIIFSKTERAKSEAARHGYRLVESLLTDGARPFANLVEVTEFHGPHATSVLVSNRHSSALVDNIFGYCEQQLEEGIGHQLLAKVRCLQICKTKRTALELSQLLDDLGYDSGMDHSIEATRAILLHSSLLRFEFDSNNNENSTFETTNRGLYALETLMFDLTYLEHVFHRTIVPKKLHQDIVHDRPRSVSALNWARSSIRNSFILLSYINFVETSCPPNVSIGDELAITDRLRRSVLGSLERILSDNFRRERQEAIQNSRQQNEDDWLVSFALKDIEDVKRCWLDEGVVS
jgi:hypothetical protein